MSAGWFFGSHLGIVQKRKKWLNDWKEIFAIDILETKCHALPNNYDTFAFSISTNFKLSQQKLPNFVTVLIIFNLEASIWFFLLFLRSENDGNFSNHGLWFSSHLEKSSLLFGPVLQGLYWQHFPLVLLCLQLLSDSRLQNSLSFIKESS